MRKIKILSLALVLIVLAGLFAGCGEKTDPSDSATDTADATSEVASYVYEQVGETENPKMVEQEPTEPLKFAFIGFANNSYWDLIYEGVDAAKDFLSQHNVTVDVINLGSDITADVINNALDSCESENYDGIVLTCFVSGCENYINACVESGCEVAIIGGDAGECERFCYIGQDNEEAGLEIAKAIDEALGGEEGATFAVITSLFSMSNIETKRNTCIEYLEDKGYVCVGSYEAHDSADETHTITEELLTAYPNLGAIYCTAGGTYGAPKAVRDNDRVGSLYVIGHDETAENLEYVRTGELDVIGQNPTGYAFDAFIYLYNKVVAGQDPAEEFMASLSQLINQANVDELFPES